MRLNGLFKTFNFTVGEVQMRFKWCPVVFVFLLIVRRRLVYGDLTKADIDKAINKTELRHPYLYFSEEE